MGCMLGSWNQWRMLSLDGTCQSYGSSLVTNTRWLLPYIQQSLAKKLLPTLWKHQPLLESNVRIQVRWGMGHSLLPCPSSFVMLSSTSCSKVVRSSQAAFILCWILSRWNGWKSWHDGWCPCPVEQNHSSVVAYNEWLGSNLVHCWANRRVIV